MKFLEIVLITVLILIVFAIGYKLGPLVMELGTSGTTPVVNTTQLTIPEEVTLSAIIRWNHFPLTIYINDSFIRNNNPNYVNDVELAFDTWQSTGMVSFKIVNTPSDADITLEWLPALTAKASDTLGDTKVTFANVSEFGIISHARIELLTKSERVQLNSDDMVNLALHEIGHAVGLEHTNLNDIMNPVLVIPSHSIKEISNNDMNRLRELYILPAKPDLKVIEVNATKATISRLGQNSFYLNVSAEIKNMGLIDAKNFNVQFSADNVPINERFVEIIEPGNGLTIFYGNIKVGRNFTSVQVYIDPENAIDELNKTNNFVDLPV